MLALHLAKLDYSVGLLDADILGSSITTICGLNNEKLLVIPSNHIIPPIVAKIKVMSFGMIKNSQGDSNNNSKNIAIFRGPMVAKWCIELLTKTRWGKLDYLIIDFPPGSGDVCLSLAQTLPNLYGLVVTTPAKLAIDEASDCVEMFDQLNVSVVGVIETMSYFSPIKGQKYHIFNNCSDGNLSKKYGLPLLGEIPIDPICAQRSDNGTLLVSYDDNNLIDDSWVKSSSYQAYQVSAIKMINQINLLESTFSQGLNSFVLKWDCEKD